MLTIPKVLVVEDDETIRNLLVVALKRLSLRVESAATGLQALELAKACDHAVILLDVNMPVMTGPQFIAAFRECCPDANPIVIIMTAYDEFEPGDPAAQRIHTVVRKPFDVENLVATIRECAYLHHPNVSGLRSASEDRQQQHGGANRR